jgi:transcriptional regulator with XRE-family HTH domain
MTQTRAEPRQGSIRESAIRESGTRERGTACGALLRQRTVRGLSQLDLSTRAGVSARHLSFVESGRARASRDMLHVLAEALDIPLRERNALLSAAGFASGYRESALEGEDLATVRRALSTMLERLEPYPCTLLDRHWNVMQANVGATKLLLALLGAERLSAMQPLNAARLLFHPFVRPLVVAWEETAGAFVHRLHREALAGDAIAQSLVDELLALPGVPRRWQVPDLERPTLPVLPLKLLLGDVRLSLFTTITTLGTPLDVTLQELRIETYFPSDAATEIALRSL